MEVVMAKFDGINQASDWENSESHKNIISVPTRDLNWALPDRKHYHFSQLAL
jgi:hypothetical protein